MYGGHEVSIINQRWLEALCEWSLYSTWHAWQQAAEMPGISPCRAGWGGDDVRGR